MGLIPGVVRAPIHYRESQQFISVPAGGSRTIRNLPAAFNGSSHVLIGLTYTPAREAIRESVANASAGGPAEATRDALKTALENLGYDGAALELVRVDAVN